MTLIDDIKRDRNQGQPVDNWIVRPHEDYPGFLVIDGPSFTITVVTMATYLDSKDYADRHADARRIARVPRMEAALLAAEECERVLTAMANRVSLYSGGHDDKLVNDAEEAITAFRKTLEAGE